MFDIIDPRCHQRFIRYVKDTLPTQGDSIVWADYVHADGRSPADESSDKPAREIVCDSCGEPVGVDPYWGWERSNGPSVWDNWSRPETWVKVEV